jgi:mpaB/rubber oxygenase-like protein
MAATEPALENARLPDPRMLQAFPFKPGLRLFIREDIRAQREQVEAFRRFAAVGDRLADDLICEMRSLPAGEGRRLFEQAVEQGIAAVDNPPPALAAFFEQVEAVPVWLDRDKLDLAARATMRSGLLGIYGPLPDIALIGGYLASRPDKVLIRAGDLEKKAPRRLAETASWLVEITSMGGLNRFAEGFKGTLRVRLTHAHIRAAMEAREDWDYEAWDHPVNQVHTVGTLILFSTVFTAGLRMLGCRFTSREREAIFHFWRYVGHLMGVHPELLPATESDTWRILWLEAATEFQPDEDSRRLTQAMIASTGELHGIRGDGRAARLATWALVGLHTSLSRLALGKDNADHLGIPYRPAFYAPVAAFFATNFALETIRKIVPGATRLSTHLGEKSRRAAVRAIARQTSADLSYTREPTVETQPKGATA